MKVDNITDPQECKTNIEYKVYGLLVLLGFAIADFTPVAYQRHHL